MPRSTKLASGLAALFTLALAPAAHATDRPYPYVHGMQSPYVRGTTVYEKLYCSGPAGDVCDGSMRLVTTRDGTLVGSLNFEVRTARYKTIKVRLNRTGRRILSTNGTLTTSLHIRCVGPDGMSHLTRSGKLHIYRQR